MAADPGGPIKGEALAERQEIPPKFLENILADLRRAGLVLSQRGADGGDSLGGPAPESPAGALCVALGPRGGPLGRRGARTAPGVSGPLPRPAGRLGAPLSRPAPAAFPPRLRV